MGYFWHVGWRLSVARTQNHTKKNHSFFTAFLMQTRWSWWVFFLYSLGLFCAVAQYQTAQLFIWSLHRSFWNCVVIWTTISFKIYSIAYVQCTHSHTHYMSFAFLRIKRSYDENKKKQKIVNGLHEFSFHGW